MITIVDYGMGNLGSIANMFKKVGASVVVSSDLEAIQKATKLVLPGVGAFDNGMACLEERGLVPLLHRRVLEDRVPILGLCLGFQLFTRRSEEGNRPGLGWINGETVRFHFEDDNAHLKIPHMGWNRVEVRKESVLFDHMSVDRRFYFVHSFHVVCADPGAVLSSTTYGYTFVSGVEQENVMGLQFHPEKSHKFGMQLFRNFAERA